MWRRCLPLICLAVLLAGCLPVPAAGDWRPVSGLEVATHLTYPITIFLSGPSPDRPPGPGEPVPFSVLVFNPAAGEVAVEGMQLELAITAQVANGPWPEVWRGPLPRLDGVLPPRGGWQATVYWNQQDRDGRPVAPGRGYRAELRPATVRYRAAGGAGAWEFVPDARTGKWFVIGHGAAAPEVTYYGPWQARAASGTVTFTFERLHLRRGQAQLEGRLRLQAYIDMTLRPQVDADGEPLLIFGHNVMEPLPGYSYPQEQAFGFTFAPPRPGARTLRLSWDGTVLEIPLSDTGEPPAAEDLQALDRLAAAIEGVVGRGPFTWNRAALDAARATRWQAQRFRHAPVVAVGPPGPDEERRSLFHRLSAALFALPDVQEVALQDGVGRMRLTREQYQGFKPEAFEGAGIDHFTGYTPR